MQENKTQNYLQWCGALLIIAGHILNAVGPSTHPWNILVFSAGTVCFFLWAKNENNTPQILVNAVSLIIGVVGLINAMY